MKPNGSYKMKSGKWWVACFECKHKDNCHVPLTTVGARAKTLQDGCAIGDLKEEFKEESPL